MDATSLVVVYDPIYCQGEAGYYMSITDNEFISEIYCENLLRDLRKNRSFKTKSDIRHFPSVMELEEEFKMIFQDGNTRIFSRKRPSNCFDVTYDTHKDISRVLLNQQ